MTLAGIVIEVKALQSVNDPYSPPPPQMDCKVLPSSKITLFKDKHWLKEKLPILVMLVGIVIEVKVLFWNALFPILVKDK